MTIRDGTTPRGRAVAVKRRLGIAVPDDLVWVAVPVGAALVVYAAYLLSHDYPAYGAGMYLQIAKQLRLGGYHPPARIHHYTAGGVPFAYPPLMFYVAAVVRDLTGVGPLTYARVVPGGVVVVTVVPYYYLARAFLDSRPRASLASVVFTVAPPVLTWHLSAGGIVRAPAFLFTLTGVYGGVRLFRAGDHRWIVPSAVLFGLTALSHPTYPVYFVLSFLLLYAFYDRSLSGLVSGALVGLGGLVLTVPWVGWVATTHGLDIFAAAAGTHSGLWGGTYRIWQQFVEPIVHLDSVTPFYAVAFLGAAVALVRRRPFVPVWMGLSGYMLAESRFLYVAGAMLVAIAVFEGLGTANEANRSLGRRHVVAAVVVAVAAVTLGALFGAGALDARHGSQTQPAFLDRGDVRAATWAERHTEPTADFVVLGDFAEWFPYLADRTILVGPWGVEWLGNAQYRHQIRLFEAVSACDSARCLTTTLDRADVHPEYVVVPKGHYTVRGHAALTSPRLRCSLIAADRYTLTYENRETMVFRVDQGETGESTGVTRCAATVPGPVPRPGGRSGSSARGLS